MSKAFGGKANNVRCIANDVFKQNQSYQFIYCRETGKLRSWFIAADLLSFSFYLWKYPLPAITIAPKTLTFQGNFTVECTG
jgi:hypothetical protein